MERIELNRERTVVLRSEEDVRAHGHVWDEVPVSYTDAELEYFLALVTNRPRVVRPHVMVVEGPERPVGLCVGYLEDTVVSARFGYFAVHRPRLRMLRVVHGGVAGTDAEPVAATLVGALEEALRAGEADVFLVPAVRVGSSLERALFAAVPSSRLHAAPASVHRRMALPDSYDAFLASRDRKSRYNLRRQVTQLEERFGERLSLLVLGAGASVEEVFSGLGAVAEKTYQHGLGAGFVDTPDRRATVAVSLARSAFRAWLLVLEERPVAFWQGTVRGRTFVLNTAGYDPEFASLGVGGYVQQRMVRDLCDDPDIDVVDFGWGDADYKARFGTEQWDEHDILVYAPTSKGRRASTIRRAVARAERTARAAAARAGLQQKVKRSWRRRLARRA